MSTIEQPQSLNVENIDKTKLERLRSRVERKVTKFVSEEAEEADPDLYVKASIMDDQMLVELFKGERHVFNGYTVVDPLLTEKKNGEGYIIKSANDVMSYWLKDPHEGLRLKPERFRKPGNVERKTA